MINTKKYTPGEIKIINSLFEKYQKDYDMTKPGQVFPKWFDDQQLHWILSVMNKPIDLQNE